MAKLPGFMFYPGDWLKDPKLRRCGHAAKGVYMDMLCLMFECEERGVLATAGSAWSNEELARAVGGDYQQTLACISELVEKGVVDRNQSGCMYSRRMVRDEEKRRLCGEAGKRGGGNPQFHKGQSKGACKGDSKGETESESENACSFESEFIEAWNLAEGNHKVKPPLNDERKRVLRVRANERVWIENWRAALAKFPLKCFSDPGGWRPDLDWFLRPKTVTKILEGNYDWSKSNAATKQTQRVGPGQRCRDPEGDC